MKKLLFLIALLSPVFCLAQKKNTGPKVFDLVIGTYTGTTPTSSKGIHIYRFYAERGEVADMSEIETPNPSYLAVSQNQKFIYAVNENSDTQSSVTAFKFDKVTGRIEQLNTQPSIGSPAYVAVDKAQKNVFIANYGGGNLQVFPVNKDGSLGASIQTIQDKGTGPDQMRQLQPHVHSTMLTPDEKYLLAADLGTDKINVYRYKASKNPPLTPASTPFITMPGGSGPRHNDFTPNGKFMYNIQEMAASITAYAYNDGDFKEIQTIKMMPDDFKGTNGAADIHVSPDGKYLYATNRGTANQIMAYAIDQLTGKLTLIERYRTGGENPRNFVIDPTGNYILVGTTNHINFFKINKASGHLSETGNIIRIESAVCLKMVPVE
jgi:6-phosphogluconolactonase